MHLRSASNVASTSGRLQQLSVARPQTTSLPARRRALQQSHQLRCRATSDEASTKPAERQIEILLLNRSVSDKVYYALEAVVVLVQLGLVDAAYSGDWSRIGVISKELEQQLQLFVQFVIVAHSMLGVVAFKIAQDKPWRNPALCALQGFAVGAMAVYEVWQDERPPRQGNSSS